MFCKQLRFDRSAKYTNYHHIPLCEPREHGATSWDVKNCHFCALAPTPEKNCLCTDGGHPFGITSTQGFTFPPLLPKPSHSWNFMWYMWSLGSKNPRGFLGRSPIPDSGRANDFFWFPITVFGLFSLLPCPVKETDFEDSSKLLRLCWTKHFGNCSKVCSRSWFTNTSSCFKY